MCGVLFCDQFRVEKQITIATPRQDGERKGETTRGEEPEHSLWHDPKQPPKQLLLRVRPEGAPRRRTQPTRQKKATMTMMAMTMLTTMLTKIGTQHGVHRLCHLHLHHLCGRAVRMPFFLLLLSLFARLVPSSVLSRGRSEKRKRRSLTVKHASREFSHRTKGISMSRFTNEEMAKMQQGGNEVSVLRESAATLVSSSDNRAI